MKISTKIQTLLVASALLAVPVRADDIDLFVGRGAQANDAPNLLIILDNTANWGPQEKFDAQKQALVDAFDSLPDGALNVGLMMFTETGGGNSNTDGGYVRAAIRPLNADTRAAYRKLLVGDPPGTGGLDIQEDDSNGGKAGLAMMEAYLYYLGGTGLWERPFAGNNKEKTDYFGNAFLNKPDPNKATCCADSHAVWALTGNALNSKSATRYNSPVDPDSCASNFILFIGNGPAQDNSSDSETARTYLQNQVGVSDIADKTLPISPSGSRDNMADEWAYFMNNDSDLDIKTFAIDVQVYKNANQCSNASAAGWTALMKNMSSGQGGGSYFGQCGDTFDAFQFQQNIGDVLGAILARNSVFASVALPAAANEQSTFLNNVYIGMFRPDAKARPRWFGNLKQYQIGKSDNELALVDAAGEPVIDTTDTETGGFVKGCARSFWTPETEAGPPFYWDFFDTDGDDVTETVENCAGSPAGSNAPDGFIVEKGGQAFVLRSSTPAFRKVLTCDPSLATCNSTGLEPFATANASITETVLDANDPTDRNQLIAWAIGEDVDNEDADSSVAEFRPSIHGDIVHSQPVAIDYANDPNNPQVVVFYGGNDGALRAINGNQSSPHGGAVAGGEFWSFFPPEFYGAIKRLRENDATIRFPSSGPTSGNAFSGEPKDYGMDGPLTAVESDTDDDGVIDQRTLLAGMRRAGRLVYSFDVTDKSSPSLNWKVGCPNLEDDVGCTSFDIAADGDSDSDWLAVGQTWSRISPMLAGGYDPDSNGEPDQLLIMGGGYDDCEDLDDGSVRNNDCASTKGNRIYVLDAASGDVVAWFATERSVPGAVTVVPLSDQDPLAIFAYAADTGGNVYRISGSTGAPDFHSMAIGNQPPSEWQITKIASLGCDTVAPCAANRKFLFGPDVVRVPNSDLFAILLGSGDREKPLTDFSVTSSVTNFFYSLLDQPLNPTWLDDSQEPIPPCGGAGDVICSNWLTTVATGDAFDPDLVLSQRGWKLPLRSGEQVVTGAITLSNVVNFSTHIPAQSQECDSDFGEATAYQVDFRDAQGDTTEFLGGGLVPTPTAGKVIIDGEPVEFCIGCGAEGSPIGAGRVSGGIDWTQPRSRVWWNIDQVDD